ncbi:NADPH-dependent 7-cyano-7-deazaguanine reductase QueF [Aromatoleum petrolei]|uniref:NADPH-dependent 7-cyano-7-deazaguanine reductase n=1 Tax=Aromatoleum petrolei TaxID=76116 RepID=A0ABX1MX87_9RHOO|nr:NADPH-dependent 7-cyano-7-deazaguanine reductase QueF [Aromatoleum petrolei]NMF90945.1 NADPH-dependent 7-cyano-7-deazaguanine reductase QueF [Aromatoleum petrolei]QTQ35980.1 NADPH-dependent 7-cyano-7-deazaguanine reductase [Aromatoleum petrolei]
MNPSAPLAHGAESSPLGKPADYCDTYSPSLLFPIARQIKRDEIGIVPGKLPFVGEDLWNAYELSWLNPRGKPVVALATFRVPADSPRLIESKSLKLYLNSCNQTRFESAEVVQATFVRDLSDAAGAPVAVEIQALGTTPVRVIAPPPGESLDELDIDIDTYQPCPDFLSAATGGEEVSETLHSHLLKSNCLVTGQPDWGCIVVRYVGPKIERAGLLRYIVSFRKHNEFHEQCVERVFCDILQRCRPQALAVWARYTRRGGLDINPFRSTGFFLPPQNEAEIRQ